MTVGASGVDNTNAREHIAARTRSPLDPSSRQIGGVSVAYLAIHVNGSGTLEGRRTDFGRAWLGDARVVRIQDSSRMGCCTSHRTEKVSARSRRRLSDAGRGKKRYLAKSGSGVQTSAGF